MGFFSKLFGKKKDTNKLNYNAKDANVVDVQSEDERMNWGMEKANLTLHYFEKCVENPSPIQQYFSIKIRLEDDNGQVEHLWLGDPSFDDDGNLFGVVGNEPIYVKTVKLDQRIGIDRNKVSDWMIIENGRLIGGYTIRAIREGLSGNDLKQFDKSIGGLFVDEGEDYFLPNFDTPEGVITAIENAYVEGDLEKVLACKDFREEAIIMLSKYDNEAMQGEAIVEKTEEMLRMAFIKQMEADGMPDFRGVKRAFPKREKISEHEYIITEIITVPDGSKAINKIKTIKTSNGWKFLAPVD